MTSCYQDHDVIIVDVVIFAFTVKWPPDVIRQARHLESYFLKNILTVTLYIYGFIFLPMNLIETSQINLVSFLKPWEPG